MLPVYQIARVVCGILNKWKDNRYCLKCEIPLVLRHKIKYCSNKCQSDDAYALWVAAYKKGLKEGGIGITIRSVSAHLRSIFLISIRVNVQSASGIKNIL